MLAGAASVAVRTGRWSPRAIRGTSAIALTLLLLTWLLLLLLLRLPLSEAGRRASWCRSTRRSLQLHQRLQLKLHRCELLLLLLRALLTPVGCHSRQQ